MQEFSDRMVELVGLWIEAMLRLARVTFEYLVGQILAVPWGNFQSLPYWKQGLLLVAATFAIYFVLRSLANVPTIVSMAVLIAAIWIVNIADLPFLP